MVRYRQHVATNQTEIYIKNHPCLATYGKKVRNEVLSKIFRFGAAIYTAVVVARSTVPNRRNCEFRVLLPRFAATA
jgi:hypothetical protein